MRHRAGLLGAALALAACDAAPEGWSPEEVRKIGSLALSQLPALPPDPSNRHGDDAAARALGEKLFFDPGLSANGAVACATCHVPDQQFQDGLALARAIGINNRRTMPLAGTAYNAWFFWDGRKDSQWSQALGPLENPVEHGTDRVAVVRHVAARHGEDYARVFGPLPALDGLPGHASPDASGPAQAAWAAMTEIQREQVNRAFANTGKAIAAFERGLMPPETRFDRFASSLASGGTPTGDAALSEAEAAGLRLFIGKGNCINCHNGPLFTDQHFHNTGVAPVTGLPADDGRASAVAAVMADPFNCLGAFSDAKPEDCGELRFMKTSGHDLLRAYKTPSLRGAASRAPYMHAGQIATLDKVIAHYDTAPASIAGHSELVPLKLGPAERGALAAFLRALDR